ncbi:DUF134 domain-containing protein [Lutibacter sp. A80]|uniref:DUF134 domain-containing protein n=1 Tax=Lutibacter sp. A80 TaxID=2918453 RepID=UPI001F0640C8|nr:DUF134 domain-containing protein [Lutibacter sp. A80]UMB59122.1 DUF134 domain-containing protein [Lutibacter sp. A80]
MPPKRKLRKIVTPPNFKGYKPYGTTKKSIDSIELLYEEYEAIKLADYKFMTHLEASKLMGISRATFARIYETGRRKIAKALVETREIKTVFGNAALDKSWYICHNCNAKFTIPKTIENYNCPMCASNNFEAAAVLNKKL